MSDEADPGLATGGLRTRVVRGVGWMLVGQVSMRLIALATTIVLAHLLTPTEIGLATEALVFSRFSFLVADIGLLAVIVQRERLSDEDRQTAFWTSTALGAVLAVGLIALAEPIASLYGEEQVEPLVSVLSLSVIFTALGLTPGALLTRELKFRSLELRTIAATAAASVVAIVLAALGYGPWAIIAQSVVLTGVSTALMWLILGWWPRLVYSWKSLRGFAGFSGYVFGSGALQYLSRNADNFLVGRYLGAAKLGAYSLAYNVMLVPMRTLASPVQNVLFPALSRIGEPGRVGDIWLRTTQLVAAVTVPAYLGMMVVAPDFVPVVFGAQWDDAIPVLQILAYVGILASWGALRATVLLALDRASIVFRLQLLGTTLSIAAFVAGLHWGIVGVATAYAVSSTFMMVYSTLVTGRVTNVSFGRFLRAISGVFEAGVVMALAVLGARLLLVDADVPQAARLAILVLLGAIVYVPVCMWRAPGVVADVRDSLRRIRSRGEPAGEATPA
jgi:O-antigen/teichoic acid export membrane protein